MSRGQRSEMSRLTNIIQLMSTWSETDGTNEHTISPFSVCVCVCERERGTPGCYNPNLTSSWPFSVIKLIQFCTDTGGCEQVKLIWLLSLHWGLEQRWENNEFSLCLYFWDHQRSKDMRAKLQCLWSFITLNISKGRKYVNCRETTRFLYCFNITQCSLVGFTARY